MATWQRVLLTFLQNVVVCSSQLIELLENDQLAEGFQELRTHTQEPPSTPGFSTPPTEGGPVTPQQKVTSHRPTSPDSEEEKWSYPLWAFNWLDRFPGTVHRHNKQLFIGTCPSCVHAKNLGHPYECANPCHLVKHPKEEVCPWCYRPATTDPTL
jgi:hypothetical protein